MADARLTLETFRHYVGRLALRPPSDDAAGALTRSSARTLTRAASSAPLRDRAAVDQREQRQQQTRARAARPEADAPTRSRSAPGAPSSPTSTLLRWRRSRCTTPRACMPSSRVCEPREEVGRQVRCDAPREPPARPVLDREGERDRSQPSEARHRGDARERAVGARLARTRSSGRASRARCRRAARSPSPRASRPACSTSSTSGFRKAAAADAARARAKLAASGRQQHTRARHPLHSPRRACRFGHASRTARSVPRRRLDAADAAAPTPRSTERSRRLGAKGGTGVLERSAD